MPFKNDSPFEKWPGRAIMDAEEGGDVEKPLLETKDGEQSEGLVASQDEEQSEAEEVEDSRGEGERGGSPQRPLVKHVHFSESLQRVLEKKEWDEEQGLDKDREEEEEEDDSTWEEFWEWAKAEAKCYANYICPVVVVNGLILIFVILYFWNRKK